MSEPTAQRPAPPAAPSLIRQLQVGFALAALLILGTFAALMDTALHRSLEREDALVLEAQAAYLTQALGAGRALPEDPGPRPEKAEWSLVRPGAPARTSPGFPQLPGITWSTLPLDGRTHEVEAADGREVSALRQALPGGELRLLMDRSHEALLVSAFRHTLWIGTLLAAAAAALLGRIVAIRGLRPLRLIAEETATVRPGDPFHPLEAARFPHELGPLIHTLNAALARLQAAIHRLDDLGSELAHELRTPLQHLRSALEDQVLRGEPVPPQALGPSLEACDRLESLIESILFLARSADPTATVQWREVDLPALLEATRDFFEGVAEENGLTLTVEAPPHLRCSADPALLTRALHNLVSNALAATPRSGHVSLHAEATATECRLHVLDTGPGLPPSVHQALGHRWNRGPGTRSHGLGLAIVHSILARHHGTLTLHPRPEGGTQATLHLPLTQAPPNADA